MMAMEQNLLNESTGCKPSHDDCNKKKNNNIIRMSYDIMNITTYAAHTLTQLVRLLKIACKKRIQKCYTHLHTTKACQQQSELYV